MSTTAVSGNVDHFPKIQTRHSKDSTISGFANYTPEEQTKRAY